jgi:hypothetical protein
MDDSHHCKNCDSLLEKIKELESKLSYYDNPNSPPSSDSIHWRKQKKQRKSNQHGKPGQKDGHKGTTNNFKPTNTINHTSEKCSRCGSKNIIQTTQQSRIIAEIPKPQPVTITKHIIPVYFCNNCYNTTIPDCSIPKKGNLGFHFVGIILSLWSARITLRNIAKMIESFYCIKISASTINNALCNTSSALEPLVNEIKKDICNSKSAHFDETKYSIHGSTGWVWTGVNQNSCFITVENSRGKKVLEKHFSSFAGVAICDGWMPYHIFNTRQRCWAHILREAKHYSEKLETNNSVSLYQSLQELFCHTTLHKIEKPDYFLYNYSIELLEKIITPYNNDKSLSKFLTKLNNAKNNLFTFLLYPGVEPTNNAAERALRESVIHRKIRGCVRNQKGMRMFGNLMSVTMTWKVRDCNILDEIVKYV